jgi:hypothetical protein
MLLAVGAFSGCSAGYTTENTSNVILAIAGINGGDPLKSDVLTDKGGVFVDKVKVLVAVRFKNPNIKTIPSIPNAVTIERYEVKYRRSDGRGVEGQDVPYTISGNMTAIYDVKSSGTDEMVLEVVRVQAKLEPPLRNLGSGSGGGIVVTMFADITLHGRTISGETVTANGTLQIDFANWADTTT